MSLREDMEASLTEEASSASKERRTCTVSDAGMEVEEAMGMVRESERGEQHI